VDPVLHQDIGKQMYAYVLVKNRHFSQVWEYKPIIPATHELETGESPKEGLIGAKVGEYCL
jgi:hypothetical protein